MAHGPRGTPVAYGPLALRWVLLRTSAEPLFRLAVSAPAFSAHPQNGLEVADSSVSRKMRISALRRVLNLLFPDFGAQKTQCGLHHPAQVSLPGNV